MNFKGYSTVIVFLLMVYALAGIGILQEDKTYSSSENRVLQTFPKVSEKKILKGKFQKKYETYLSDQFPARDGWIQVKSRMERLLGKTESNGVYFGKNKYLLEKYTKEDFDKKQGKKNIAALKKFVEGILGEEDGEQKKTASKQKTSSGQSSYPNVKVMMVPSKTDILEQNLPLFAQSYDEDIFYRQLEEALGDDVLVPVKESLQEHREEYIYYRNDHHWTTLGAWYGYEAYLEASRREDEIEEDTEFETKKTDIMEEKTESAKKIKKDGMEKSETKESDNQKSEIMTERKNAEKKKQALKSVSTDFLGTTYSKVNMYFEPDEIFVYEPEGDFSVTYNLGEKTEDTFFQWEYLEKKDQYSVFSGGNQGVLEITGGEKNGRTLFVVKDSFANCMIPFLMEDYEKVVVVDMRQLNAGLSMVMRMYEPTDVLVLYNLVQFMQDRDFAMKP